MVTSGNTRSHREKLLQTSIPVWLQFVKTDPGPESIKCRETTNDNLNETRGSGTMPPSKQDLHVGRLTFLRFGGNALAICSGAKCQPQPRSFWPYQGIFDTTQPQEIFEVTRHCVGPLCTGATNFKNAFRSLWARGLWHKSRRIETKRTISTNHPKLIRGRKEPDLGIAQI